MTALILCATLFVIDGDTLVCAGEKIRLWGIDAPDFACRGRLNCRQDKTAAAQSRNALVRLTADTEVHCRPLEKDRYGRTVARCYARGVDLGCAMIRQGHAVEILRYSRGSYEGCRP
jgi:micrococcal nuclease